MSRSVISVENLSKSYRLGQIGTGTLTNDLKVWLAHKSGKPNPLLKIGQIDHGNLEGETLWALRDVSFRVEQGEVLGIIGRNGAGKSTLLKILSRVTAPTSGLVKVKGRIASLLEVGTGFHPDLTGKENIYLNGAILGMTKEEIQRKFDEIVAFAEIEKFIDTPVKRYSSGMYVRLAFAVAAHLESEILLVDEVLAVGDAEFQKKCLGKMGDVAINEGRTLLFVSHNMAAINQLCPQSIQLKSGKIAEWGKTSKIVESYVTVTTTHEGYIDTTNFSQRRGSGEGRITGIEMRNLDGQMVSSIGIKEPFVFKIFVKLKEPLSNLVVGIDIKNSYGLQVIHIRSDSQGMTFGPFEKDKNVIFEVIVPGLPLYPGKYFFEPWFCKKYGERIDNIEKDISVFIDRKGIMESEKMIIEGRGIILVDCQWDGQQL